MIYDIPEIILKNVYKYLELLFTFIYLCVTKAKNMTHTEIKSKGVLQSRENGAELYLVIGKWNEAAKKPDMHWYMISEKTGTHVVTSQSNRMEERVRLHWDGFKANQNK